jgi:NAD(P)-dependent dehydrogenase (short-subunit alcohol dehydrogenase family)
MRMQPNGLRLHLRSRRDEQAIGRATGELRSAGRSVIGVTCNVTDRGQVTAMVEHVVKKKGGGNKRLLWPLCRRPSRQSRHKWCSQVFNAGQRAVGRSLAEKHLTNQVKRCIFFVDTERRT